MSDLRQRLARLGLSQYVEVFTAEGFDTWDTVLDITESDLSLLNVKLGHRRKLQRAIAETRGQTSDRPLPIALGRGASAEVSYRSGDESAPESKGKQGEAAVPGSGASVTSTTTKRKYRRHPKPDEHAPERPPSAYVIFSNQVRELLKGQELSFTEIAKIVGERWQVLPGEEREACERQANTAKERYYAELAEYKKTPQYEAYQKYLEDFKAKHAVPTKGQPPLHTFLTGLELTRPEGKRSRLETETSTSTRSSSHDQNERPTSKKTGSTQLDPSASAASIARSESSPSTGPARLPTGSSFSSKPTSPISQTPSTFSSMRTADHYSPISASPRSAMFDPVTNNSRDPRTLPDAPMPLQPHYAYPPLQTSGTTSNNFPMVSRHQNPLDVPSRRTMHDSSTRIPILSHEDTTWSSESGHSGSGYNVATPGFPETVAKLDPGKTMRILPQPVPSIGPLPSPLDRSHHTVAAQIPALQPDYRTQGPLAALVRAGEIAAKIADDETVDIEGSP
ncbi:hypothetical protein IQ06DRAFT_3492 [Phaeosphaeriaceae sp. SRC1lsM3a]|nr:hypothetical protein IQ06DRAFT_3492 [Stagonospora sp. SRC1lsM3a]